MRNWHAGECETALLILPKRFLITVEHQRWNNKLSFLFAFRTNRIYVIRINCSHAAPYLFLLDIQMIPERLTIIDKMFLGGGLPSDHLKDWRLMLFSLKINLLIAIILSFSLFSERQGF